MKYANIFISNTNIKNIGSNMQIMAIDMLYENMGIFPEDIIRIDFNKMDKYDGEECILPINYYFHNFFKYGEENIFSDKIRPIFIGVSFFKNLFSDKEVTFLKKCEPIGCRDEYTYYNLKKYGIKVYLAGCITAILPEREVSDQSPNTVFLVDIPPEIEKVVKQNCDGKYESVSHVYRNAEGNIQEYAENLYNKYKKEARIVITSRLHCAVPCMAAGIPVVLIMRKKLHTTTWLDRLIPVYEESEINRVNWSPSAIHYKEFKERVLNIAEGRLLQKDVSDEYLEELSSFYLRVTPRSDYSLPVVTDVLKWIDYRFNNSEIGMYAFWGVTPVTDMIDEYIRKKWANATLTAVYDKERSMKGYKYRGIVPLHPDLISERDDNFIFVTAYSAMEEAEEKFRQIKRSDDSYCLCCSFDSV